MKKQEQLQTTMDSKELKQKQISNANPSPQSQ